MKSPFWNHDPNIRGLGNSDSGHVCHSPQYPPSSVHVSDSGALALAVDALAVDAVSGLAGEVNVHVSAVPLAQQSYSEIMCHSGGDPNSPLVAITTMVSTHTSTLCEPPSVLSIPPRSVVTTGTSQTESPSARMEALMHHYKAAGFLEEVSRLAASLGSPSTNRKVRRPVASLHSLGLRARI